MDRLVKILIIVNGIIIPICISILLYKTFLNSNDSYYPNSDGLILGEELEKAINDTLALQGLNYEDPISIYNSNNFYLPISVMTYQEAKLLKEIASSAGDIGHYGQSNVNVIFLDKDYKVIGMLLDRKASINSIQVGIENRYSNDPDTTVKNLVYEIGFKDTNGDKKLDHQDDSDLYISDLNGKNLQQVTNNINVLYYTFFKSNSSILIRYTERDNLRPEHRSIKFGVYTVNQKSFKKLEDIDRTLLEIEKIIVNR